MRNIVDEVQARKMLVIAEYVFRNEDMSVSIGTKHAQSNELTVLIAGGRIEYNSFKHRRDAWDVAIKFNLYVKKLEDGTYEAGTHDVKDERTFVSVSPTVAVSEMAFLILFENNQ